MFVFKCLYIHLIYIYMCIYISMSTLIMPSTSFRRFAACSLLTISLISSCISCTCSSPSLANPRSNASESITSGAPLEALMWWSEINNKTVDELAESGLVFVRWDLKIGTGLLKKLFKSHVNRSLIIVSICCWMYITKVTTG